MTWRDLLDLANRQKCTRPGKAGAVLHRSSPTKSFHAARRLPIEVLVGTNHEDEADMIESENYIGGAKCPSWKGKFE